MQLEEHPEMEILAKKKYNLKFMGCNLKNTQRWKDKPKREFWGDWHLQPRDKAAMLGVNTIALFLEEFTWK